MYFVIFYKFLLGYFLRLVQNYDEKKCSLLSTNTSNEIKNKNVLGPKHATGHNKMQPDVAFSICI